MAKTSAADNHHKTDHEFHLVDPSPWPLMASLGFLIMAGSAAFYFHNEPYTGYGVLGGLVLLLYVGFRWWRDCAREGKAHHTSLVRKGLRSGMGLFILSEVMFFFAFFYSFFHSAINAESVIRILILLVLIVAVSSAWIISVSKKNALGTKISMFALIGLVTVMALSVGIDRADFPGADQKIVSAWGLPLFNTLLLLTSGTTVTWAHAALLNGDKKGLVNGLICTIILGLVFTAVQAYEYKHIMHELFKFEDNNFTANFFMATGFHGLHVIIGTIFLTICLIRALKNQFSEEHHLGFEFAAWYWHFVDVVWLFLFTFVYVWTGWGLGAH